ncbi:MAG: sulfurtransferase, partial [Microbacterium sp.]|nr:sulfurtransferase [Microbacterium sp.]
MTDALEYFSAKLLHETDPSDVYAAQKAGEHVVLVDVRGDDAWAQGRISG